MNCNHEKKRVRNTIQKRTYRFRRRICLQCGYLESYIEIKVDDRFKSGQGIAALRDALARMSFNGQAVKKGDLL